MFANTRPPGAVIEWTKGMVATRCGHCDSTGIMPTKKDRFYPCGRCDGAGWIGIDPRVSVDCRPGSDAKRAVLATRYAAGAPLHRDGDYGFYGRQPVATATGNRVYSAHGIGRRIYRIEG